MKIETTLEQMRDDYDWREVFRHANGERTQQEQTYRPTPVLGSSVSDAHFGLCCVAELLGSVEGEHDGPEWVAVGRLHDGRFFSIKAGCDYTGWD